MCQLPSSAVEEPIFVSFLVIRRKVNYSVIQGTTSPKRPSFRWPSTPSPEWSPSTLARPLGSWTTRLWSNTKSSWVSVFSTMWWLLIGLQLSSRLNHTVGRRDLYGDSFLLTNRTWVSFLLHQILFRENLPFLNKQSELRENWREKPNKLFLCCLDL